MTCYLRPLTAALVMAFGTAVQGAPSGGNVVNGGATFTQNGSQLIIKNTPGTIINWNSFNIGRGESVWFHQMGPGSAVLNRVIGGSPSEILGHLGSNGRVFLINPSGILFGHGAVLDTAGFVASTLNLSDADWKAGRIRLSGGSSSGDIVLSGAVRASNGDVYLIARNIDNNGALIVESGNAILAAGETVQMHARGLDGISFEVSNGTGTLRNLGSVQAGAVGMFARNLTHSGSISAYGAGVQGGRVFLYGSDSATLAAGSRIDASSSTGRGGEVALSGREVMMRGGATIDASGAAGGGAIYVGGGWRGQDGRITNAANTTIERGAVLNSNANVYGDGGLVVAWSEGVTTVDGAKISARGGELGGNGGVVETSGKVLRGFAAPDVRAPNGQLGTWLLDPDEIIIQAGASGSGPMTFPGTVKDALTGTTVIFEDDIEAYNAGNILLEANGRIGTNGTFTGGLSLNNNTTMRTLNTAAGASFCLATGRACGIQLDTNVVMNGFALTLDAQNQVGSGTVNIATNGAISGASFVTMTSAGGILVPGGITATNDITLSTGINAGSIGFLSPVVSKAGNVILETRNIFDLDGASIRAESPDKSVIIKSSSIVLRDQAVEDIGDPGAMTLFSNQLSYFSNTNLQLQAVTGNITVGDPNGGLIGQSTINATAVPKLALLAAGDILIGGNTTLNANNLSLNGNFIGITAAQTGSVNVNVAGNLTVDAQQGFLVSGMRASPIAGALADRSAVVTVGGAVDIKASVVEVIGGDAANNRAVLDPAASMRIDANSVVVRGGTATGASAEILAGGDITFNVGDSTKVFGGSASGAYGAIRSTGGNVTFAGPGNLALTSSPNAGPGADTVVYAFGRIILPAAGCTFNGAACPSYGRFDPVLDPATQNGLSSLGLSLGPEQFVPESDRDRDTLMGGGAIDPGRRKEPGVDIVIEIRDGACIAVAR
jgi:filamentous hemagglutinin family protein